MNNPETQLPDDAKNESGPLNEKQRRWLDSRSTIERATDKLGMRVDEGMTRTRYFRHKGR